MKTMIQDVQVWNTLLRTTNNQVAAKTSWLGRTLTVALLLLTLGVGEMWAGAGLYEVYFEYSYNGLDKNATYTSSTTTTQTISLGTLTSDFKITGLYLKYWKDGSGNMCGGLVDYYLTSDEEYQPSWSWTGLGGNNHQLGWSGTWTIAQYNNGNSGNYTFWYRFKTWGSSSSSSGCSSNYYIPNNSNVKNKFTYSIAPPALSSFTITASGHVAGSGTSSDPYIVPYGGTLTLTSSGGTKAHTDDNSSVQFSTDNSSFGTATDNTTKTISNVTNTSKQDVSLYAKCYNSSASLSGTTKTQTVYYRAAALNTITLNKGTSGTSGGSMTIREYATAYTSYTPATRTDWSLTGYFTEASNGTKVIDANGNLVANISNYTNSSGQWIGGNKTLYAQWKQTYAVTYYANFPEGTTNSGSVPTDATEYNSGASVTVKSNTGSLSVTGYNFNGWNTRADGLGTARAAGSKFNISSNTALYAQWTENMTTVTISVSPAGSGTLTVGGESFTSGNTTTAGVTTQRTVVATPYPGYKFSSWSKTGNATGSNSTNTYTLKGNGSGSTGTLTATNTPTYAYIQGRFHVTNSSRNGTWTNTFSAGDWNEASTRIQFNYDATNHRFYLHTYATPKELTTQISSLNPYFYIKTSTSNSSLDNVVSYWSSSSTTMSTAGTGGKKTLIHSGSVDNDNLRFNSSDESGYVILYFDEAGIWYELEQTLQYNANGGTGSAPAALAYYDKGTNATAASNTYSRSGYTFAGWNTKANGSGTSYAAGASVPMNSNITLYAQWNETTYAVTINNGDHGTVSPTGSQQIGGSGLQITATPASGYKFDSWSKTGSGVTLSSPTDNPTTVTATGTGSVTANYSLRWALLGSSKDNDNYYNGMPGWDKDSPTKLFSNVVGNVATCNVILTANYDYKFKIYDLQNGAYHGQTGSGNITNGEEWTLNGGTDVYFKTTIAGSYTFSIDISGTYPKVTITYPSAFTVTYGVGTVKWQSAAATASYSSTTVTSGDYVPSGTSVTFTATAANTGYQFEGWYSTPNTSGTKYSSSLSFSREITANFTCYAVYSEPTYTVTVTKDPSTYGSVSPASVTVGAVTESGNITATPSTGYTFTGWTATTGIDILSPSAATTKIKASQAGTLTANFAEGNFTMTVQSANEALGKVKVGDGAAAASTEATAHPVTTVTLTAVPQSGATFSSWSAMPSGTTITSGSLTTSTITIKSTAAGTITANFTETKYSVTLTNANASQGTVNTSSPVSVGQITAVQIQATPNTGYMFAGWQKTDGAGTITYRTGEGTGQVEDGGGAGKQRTYITTTGAATLQATWGEDRSSGYFVHYGNDGKNADGGSDPSMARAWASGTLYKPAGETAGTVSYWTFTASVADVGKVIEFKVKTSDGNTWYGYSSASGGKIEGSISDKTLSTSYGNGRMTIPTPGDYVFKWDSSTKRLSITYPAGNYLRGDFNDWGWGHPLEPTGDDNTYSATISLTGSNAEHLWTAGTQGFKICFSGVHYGKNSTTITASSNSASDCSSSGSNIGLATTIGGDYVFTYNSSTKTVTVTYPTIPAMTGTLTFDDSMTGVVCGAGTAENPFIVFKDETLTLSATHGSAPSTDADHIWYQFTVNGSAKTAQQGVKTFSPSTSATTGAIPFKVKSYYEYGPTGYKAQGTPLESATYYYKVVEKPTVSLSIPKPVTQIANSFAVNITPANTSVSCVGGKGPWYRLQFCKWNGSAWGAWVNFNPNPQTSITSAMITTDRGVGFYKWRVQMYYGGTAFDSEKTRTFTSGEVETCMYKPYMVTINVTDAAKSNGEPWFRGVYAYRENNTSVLSSELVNRAYPGERRLDCCEQINGSTFVYIFKYPLHDHLILNDYTSNSANQTVELAITNNTCITLTGTNNSNTKSWTYTYDNSGTNGCGMTYYRIRSVYGTFTYYSNIITDQSEQVSFFAGKSGVSGNKLYKETLTTTSPKWTSTAEINPTVSADGVYVGTYNNLNSTLAPYTGDFYVRTNMANGRWANYTNADNKMTKFGPLVTYDHYWVRYSGNVLNDSGNEIGDGTAVCVDAEVGNAINPCLAYPIQNYSGTRTDEGNMVTGKNVRYSYNSKTNWFDVAVIGASTEQSYVFLSTFGADNGGAGGTSQKVFKVGTGDTKGSATKAADASQQVKFIDLSNWLYQADVYVVAPAGTAETDNVTIGIEARLPGTLNIQNIVPREKPLEVIGKMTTGGDYKVRIIYDYKTNTIISGWLPRAEETISSNKVIEGNMILNRVDNADVQQVTIEGSNKISSLHNIYMSLEMKRDGSGSEFTKVHGACTLNPSTKKYVSGGTSNPDQTMFYWICLPYDCDVREIFGMPTEYGDKWAILGYAGDLRAQYGLYNDTETYWRFLGFEEPYATDYIMHAGVGYVLAIDLAVSDFHDIVIDNESRASIFAYFPTTTSGFTLENTPTKPIVYTPYVCTIPNRLNRDSGWRLIGVPGFNNVTLADNDLKDGVISTEGRAWGAAFSYKYVYKNGIGNENGNVSNVGADNQYQYIVEPAGTYKAFHAYYVQYNGTIDWSNVTTNKASVRRKAPTSAKQYEPANLRMTISRNDIELDNTFISLAEGANDEFEMNLDLTKVINNKATNVYTLIGTQRVAANVLPLDEQQVPVGVKIAADGDYTIAAENIPQGMMAILVDQETGLETDLALDSYEVALEAGTSDSRFYLRLAPAQTDIATDLSANGQAGIGTLSATITEGKLLLSGIGDEGADISVFDAAGRLVYDRRTYRGEVIDLPATSGVFLVRSGQQVIRVVK